MVTIAAVSPISIGVRTASGIALDQVEAERVAFVTLDAAADALDRRHHAAVAPENSVRERDDADVRRRGGGEPADVFRNLDFGASRVERADGHEGSGSRA